MIKAAVQTKSKSIVWTDAGRSAFALLQDAINNCPKLYYVDYSKDSRILLCTDASDYAIGAYLYQVIEREGKLIEHSQ